MKKFLFLTVILIALVGNAQEFNKWAVNVEAGIHSINDESAVDLNTKYHLGAGVRYNITPTFGLSASFGVDNIDLVSLEGLKGKTEIYNGNLEATINVFRLLDLYSPKWTILAHGGVGISVLSGLNDETLFNSRIGGSLLYRVDNKVAVKLDYSTLGFISQESTLDGQYPNNNYGITSTMHTASVGLIFYIGKKEKHADWYEYPEVKHSDTTIYMTKTIKETVTIREDCKCTTPTPIERVEPQFVFFDHDKDNVKDSELNTIYKIYDVLQKNPEYRLEVKGFASPTKSSASYNQKLSERRTKAVLEKLKTMGMDMSKVIYKSYGKDLARKDISVHDVARRVEMLLVK